MAAIHWAHQVWGLYTNAADWTGGKAPGAGDDAIIDAAGPGASEVVALTNETVASIQTSSRSTLTIRGANINFTTTNGTASGANAGAIVGSQGVTWMGDASTGATITNTGIIEALAGGRLNFFAIIDGDIVQTSTGGVLRSETGADFMLVDTTVAGGTLESVGGNGLQGVFQVQDLVLDGSKREILNEGFLEVGDSKLTLKGVIVNTDTISLMSPGDPGAQLTIGAGNVALSGGGQIALDSSGRSAIFGAVPTAVFYNIDNTISGAGGIAKLILINEAKGVIDCNVARRFLSIFTGGMIITNAGLIEATGGGTVNIGNGIHNSGTLEANGGTLWVLSAITGGGSAIIGPNGGTLLLDAPNLTQNVSFTGATGDLILVNSRSYSGTVTGLSHSAAGSELDLRDITFVGANQATFSGNASGGTLTVTDGTHTASIKLSGDYRGSTFVTSSDHDGGVLVVDPAASTGVQHFAMAMAALGARPMTARLLTPSIEHHPAPMLAVSPRFGGLTWRAF